MSKVKFIVKKYLKKVNYIMPWNPNAAVNGYLELTLLKSRQRFNAISGGKSFSFQWIFITQLF